MYWKKRKAKYKIKVTSNQLHHLQNWTSLSSASSDNKYLEKKKKGFYCGIKLYWFQLSLLWIKLLHRYPFIRLLKCFPQCSIYYFSLYISQNFVQQHTAQRDDFSVIAYIRKSKKKFTLKRKTSWWAWNKLSKYRLSCKFLFGYLLFMYAFSLRSHFCIPRHYFTESRLAVICSSSSSFCLIYVLLILNSCISG